MSIADTATAAGFAVFDDGQVRAPDIRMGNPDLAAAETAGQAALDNTAETHEVNLRAALRTFGELDTHAAEALEQITIRMSTFGGSFRGRSVLTGESYRDGESDAELIRSGTATDSDIARIGGNLSSEQGVSIDYLDAFYNGIGNDGLFDLYDNYKELEAAGDPAAARAADGLANGLLTLSNPEYGGGWDKVPEDLRETIRHGYEPESGGRRIGNLYDVDRLGALIGDANPQYRPGTEMSLEFARVSSAMAETATWHGGTIPDYPGESGHDRTIETFLDIGTRNTDASYHLLTGTDADGNPAAYNRDEVLVPLLSYNWSDDGATLAGLTDWIAEDARPLDPGDPVQLARSEHAGQAAYGLAQVLSTHESGWNGANNFDQMLHLPGVYGEPGTESIGTVNPVAVQSFSGALSPYVADMVGAGEELTGTHGFGDLGPVEATRVFTVLDTDPAAGTLINGAALARAAEFDRAFALEANDGNIRYDYGMHAGRLQGLVDVGLNSSAANTNLDGQAAVDAQDKSRADAYSVAQTLVTGAVAMTPFGAVTSPIVYSVGTLVSTDIIDAQGKFVGEAPASAGADLTPTGIQTARTYNMLSALIDDHRIEPTQQPGGDNYLENGRLKPISQLSDDFRFNRMPAMISDAGIGMDDQQWYLNVAENGKNDPASIIYAGQKDGTDAFTDVLVNDNARVGTATWEAESR